MIIEKETFDNLPENHGIKVCPESEDGNDKLIGEIWDAYKKENESLGYEKVRWPKMALPPHFLINLAIAHARDSVKFIAFGDGRKLGRKEGKSKTLDSIEENGGLRFSERRDLELAYEKHLKEDNTQEMNCHMNFLAFLMRTHVIVSKEKLEALRNKESYVSRGEDVQVVHQGRQAPPPADHLICTDPNCKEDALFSPAGIPEATKGQGKERDKDSTSSGPQQACMEFKSNSKGDSIPPETGEDQSPQTIGDMMGMSKEEQDSFLAAEIRVDRMNTEDRLYEYWKSRCPIALATGLREALEKLENYRPRLKVWPSKEAGAISKALDHITNEIRAEIKNLEDGSENE